MSTNDKRSGDEPSDTKCGAIEQPLTSFFDVVEELVSRVTGLPDADTARLRARMESFVASARRVLQSGARTVVDSTTGAAKAADAFVRRRPWKAIGAAALACLAVGAVLRRR